MTKFPKENATLYYLADTTTSTTDTVPAGEDVTVGNVVNIDGEKDIEKPFGIVTSVNGSFNDKLVNKNMSVYSAGRVWVETDGEVEAGAVAYYKEADNKYGADGDLAVGTFLTSGDSPNVIQIDFNIEGGE